MNLQVIVSGDGWVLDKYAHILAEGLGGVVRTRPEQIGEGGITYLMNYNQIRKLGTRRVYGRVVSMLTHMDADNPHLLLAWGVACADSDALVPMSGTTASDIPELDRHKATTIPLPVRNAFTQRRPRIGIAACRNAGNEYRKGWDLVDRLRVEHPEWDIVTTGGDMPESELVGWYRSLDLYLCASRYEGGPMGVVEAEACGVPIVAPRGVGWCDDLLQRTSRFDAGDYDDMTKRIRFALPDARICSCWEEADYIEAHRKLFVGLGVA